MFVSRAPRRRRTLAPWPAMPAVLALTVLALTALGLAAAPPATAQITPYATRAAFNTAFPGLPLETFDSANVAPNTLAQIPSPVDKTTNNAVFTTGSIQDGLRVSATGPNSDAPTALGVAGVGINGYNSKAVYNNIFQDALSVSFYNNGGVQAVGLDLLSIQNAATQTVTVFSGTTTLGIFTPLVSPTGTFFGISSGGAPITSLSISGGDLTRGVDNVAFGPAPEPSPATSLVLGAAGAAGLILRARRRTAPDVTADA